MSIIVVTGGAGFIGSHLTTYLGQEGHQVRVLDNFIGIGAEQRAAKLEKSPNVTIMCGDIRDLAACRRVCHGADYILHHAAEPSVTKSVEDPATCAAINIGGTINMLVAADEAKTVKRFVFASSCAVYGDSSAIAKTEDSPLDPITPYATTKLCGELLCQCFFRLHGLQTVSLRYFNVYGPGQDPDGAYAAVIPKFLTAIAHGARPLIYGDGEQSRDFVYIGDIVQANLRALQSPEVVAGKVFNVGGGRQISLNQLIRKLEVILGKKVEPLVQDPRPGDIKHSCADIAAAENLLSFSPTVDLEDGLARTLQWYLEQKPAIAVG